MDVKHRHIHAVVVREVRVVEAVFAKVACPRCSLDMPKIPRSLGAEDIPLNTRIGDLGSSFLRAVLPVALT